MARITVEDCLQKIPNRFQLVMAATYRARMLIQGHTPKIESRNKPGVTALREIAAGQVGTLRSISRPTWPAAISRRAVTLGLLRDSILGV